MIELDKEVELKLELAVLGELDVLPPPEPPPESPGVCEHAVRMHKVTIVRSPIRLFFIYPPYSHFRFL